MFTWILFVMHAFPLLDTVCTGIPFVHVGVWQLCRVLYSTYVAYTSKYKLIPEAEGSSLVRILSEDHEGEGIT